MNEKKPRNQKSAADKLAAFATRRNAHLAAIEKIDAEEAAWVADRKARAEKLTAGLAE